MDQLLHAMKLAKERGASSWLTSLPLEEYGFSLHKSAFRDGSGFEVWVALWGIFLVQHVLSCPKGGFPSIQHNEARDTLSCRMSEVCDDVCTEPTLQPITGETFSNASANTKDGARLDIAANGFWGGHFERAYFDVRVVNPNAPSNCQRSLVAMYKKHERAKIGAYEQRV